MARRLVPLTDEIKDSSLLNVKTWDGSENCEENSASSQESLQENGEGSGKVKHIVTQLNKKASSKFNVFATKCTDNVQEAQKSSKEAIQVENKIEDKNSKVT